MRARDVMGRRIVRVEQHRFWNRKGREWTTSVDAIVLDNGTRIRFGVTELIDGYAITADALKKENTA